MFDSVLGLLIGNTAMIAGGGTAAMVVFILKK